ncbi:response regulator [Paraburkholderia bryophila]|nr:response regulator [Paraburkholderia bryophila]
MSVMIGIWKGSFYNRNMFAPNRKRSGRYAPRNNAPSTEIDLSRSSAAPPQFLVSNHHRGRLAKRCRSMENSGTIFAQPCFRDKKRNEINAIMHTILLVDDEPEILAAWRLILEMEGYAVVCASNGVEALARVESCRVDLVVTDWMMPHIDGGELCTRLKRKPEFANVPILVHTSSQLSEGKKRNWQGYVRKPAEAVVFLSAVAELLHND